jgi:hypothetical protein
MHDENPEAVESLIPGFRFDMCPGPPPGSQLEVEDLEQAMDRAASGTDTAAAWVGYDENALDAADQAKGFPKIDQAPEDFGLLII